MRRLPPSWVRTPEMQIKDALRPVQQEKIGLDTGEPPPTNARAVQSRLVAEKGTPQDLKTSYPS
jgi:hypothetical protein